MALIYPDKFPSDISASSRRRGERLLFTSLSRSTISDLRVYYSRLWRQEAFNGASASSHFNGEADFIVFIPSQGFLFIECKGGVVSRDSNGFHTQDKAGRVFKIKNPFEQAKRSMYAFINHIMEFNILKCSRSELLSICQYSAFFPESESAVDFQNSFNREPTFSGFSSDLSGIDKWLYSQFPAQDPVVKSTVLLPYEVNSIHACLDPCASFGVSPRSLFIETETFFEQPFNPTQNQYFTLQQLERLSDVVVEGPAGTGKSLIGIEVLKSRSSTLGPPSLFLCHSSELVDYYSSKYSSLVLNSLFLSYSRFFAYLLRLAPSDLSPADSIVALLRSSGASFSSIVVDELQDFDPAFVRELRSLCAPSSMFLGLFDGNQALLAGHSESAPIGSYEFKSQLFLYSNIRNSQQINSFVGRHCPGLPYLSCIAPSGPSVVPWGKYTDVPKSFLLRFRRLIAKNKLNHSDIVVLVANDGDLELISTFDADSSCSYLNEHTFPGLGLVRCSTIFAFKGLEALCVIVWAKSTSLSEYERYVAFTRARTLLVYYE